MSDQNTGSSVLKKVLIGVALVGCLGAVTVTALAFFMLWECDHASIE